MKGRILTLLALSTFVSAGVLAADPSSTRPNILLITADDLGNQPPAMVTRDLLLLASTLLQARA